MRTDTHEGLLGMYRYRTAYLDWLIGPACMMMFDSR